MVKRRKVELYEILANSSGATPGVGAPAGDPLADQHMFHHQPTVRQRTGRDIVFSLDGAFVIFVVFLLLLGTSFFLGYKSGQAEIRAQFTRGADEAPARLSSGVGLLEQSPGNITGGVEIAPGKFTLRLISLPRSGENLDKLRARRLSLLATPVVASNNLEVLIFDRGQGGYTLALGLFNKRDGEILNMLREYFADSARSSEYGSVSVESVDDLGKALM